MAPPPSQAGKFKPRKPGKKIVKPGQTGDSTKAPDAAASSNSAAAGGRGLSAELATGRGSGRGGRGRGGGRGGRGRIPLPRGQVFFTGQPDPKQSTAGARKRAATPAGASSSTSTTIGRPGGNEEIVGTLEQGVGSNIAKSSAKSNILTKNDENDFFEDEAAAPTTKLGKASALYYSDSDSSADDRRTRTIKSRDDKDASQPLTLPFPQPNDVSAISYFGKDRKDWFLLQLPTRLLALAKQEEVEDITDGKEDAEVEVIDGVETAPVSTKPIANGAFDNTFSKAPPGRIGKLRVYKSGRTELVLGDGVVMDVSEGLTCGFQQQAVVVDLDTARFVPIGQVKETFVVTPNIH
jgi:RNA polymerase III RPC4